MSDQIEPLCPAPSGAYSEMYIVVRSEEKQPVMRCLESVVALNYTVLAGLGRGSSGGLTYSSEKPKRRPWSRWTSSSPLRLFLPKTIFYLVVETSLGHRLLEAVQETLKVCGGPPGCARGFAVLTPLEEEVVIDSPPVRVRTLHEERFGPTEPLSEAVLA